MKITPVYENQVFAVPYDKVTKKLASASREELAVLLSVLADPFFTPSDRASALNLTEKTFLEALAMWQRIGVLAITETGEGEEAKAVSSPAVGKQKTDGTEGDEENRTAVRKTVHARRELPHYTAADAADYLEHHQDIKGLVDCCQNISGDMFSARETEILIGMHDYLALSPEYIMLLFAHAKKLGKRSVRYVETLAIRFFDEGVTGYGELEERLQRIEKIDSEEQFIRKLFGLKSRALIAKEKAMVEKWFMTMQYDRSVIEKAYEVTISNTQKPSMDYANAVLENWYKAGLKTLEEVENSIAEYQKAREKTGESQPAGTSFDTDDFFAAALRRSYEEG